jgi:hypothetical protein
MTHPRTAHSPGAPKAPRSIQDAAALLAGTVHAALEAMADLRRPAAALLDGRIEADLRGALAYQSPTTRDPQSAIALGSAAARSACAHLSAKAWTEAHQALLAAQEHLGLDQAGPR